MTDTSLEQLSKFGITELWQVGLVMPLQYKDLRLVQYDLNPYQRFSGRGQFGYRKLLYVKGFEVQPYENVR